MTRSTAWLPSSPRGRHRPAQCKQPLRGCGSARPGPLPEAQQQRSPQAGRDPRQCRTANTAEASTPGAAPSLACRRRTEPANRKPANPRSLQHAIATRLPAIATRTWTHEKDSYQIYNNQPAAALTDGSRRILVGKDSGSTLVAGHGGPFPIAAHVYVPNSQATADRFAAEALRTILPDLDKWAARSEDDAQRTTRRIRAQQAIAMAVPDSAIKDFTWQGDGARWPHSRTATAGATLGEDSHTVTITAPLTLATAERVLPLLLSPPRRRPWRTIKSVYSPVGRRLVAAYPGLSILHNQARCGTEMYDTTELGQLADHAPIVRLILPAPQRATPEARLHLTATTGLDLAVALIPKLAH